MSTAPNVSRASFRPGQVGLGIDGLDAEFGFDSGTQFFDFVLVAQPVEHDVGALAGIGLRAGFADAGGRAGDEGRFLVKKSHGSIPFKKQDGLRAGENPQESSVLS